MMTDAQFKLMDNLDLGRDIIELTWGGSEGGFLHEMCNETSSPLNCRPAL